MKDRRKRFVIGWLFVEKADTVMLATAIYVMLTNSYLGGAQPWSYMGSLVLIMSVPVVVIFLIVQRTLMERMMFGSTQN